VPGDFQRKQRCQFTLADTWWAGEKPTSFDGISQHSAFEMRDFGLQHLADKAGLADELVVGHGLVTNGMEDC